MTSRHAIFATIALAGLTIAGTSMAQGLTREQVRAELAQAVAQGTLIADGQTGATFRDLSPTLYPQMQATLPQNRDAQNAQSRQAPGAM